MLHAKNGEVRVGIGAMAYVRFGSGRRTLIMLPGLGDGLATVRGKALPMALMYRALAKDFTVYMFSRRDQLPQGMTIRDMAHELCAAMDALGIARADVIGVSMGGMIAQEFAAAFPDRVGRLVLTVTCPAANPILTEAVQEWIGCARRGDHTALMESNVRRMYSPAYYRKNRWMIPVMGRLTRPESYGRFLIQAEACLQHDARPRLKSIAAPTLVIGGEMDRTLGGEASRELAGAIPGAELIMYPEGAHALYEEEKDFLRTVQAFLNKA